MLKGPEMWTVDPGWELGLSSSVCGRADSEALDCARCGYGDVTRVSPQTASKTLATATDNVRAVLPTIAHLTRLVDPTGSVLTLPGDAATEARGYFEGAKDSRRHHRNQYYGKYFDV